MSKSTVLKDLKTPEEKRNRRLIAFKHNIKKHYKMTLDEYHLMWNNQDGKCTICKNDLIFLGDRFEMKACVDHCHKTGKIRGLLCFNCNTGLGKFNDSIELLEEAIKYLKGF